MTALVIFEELPETIYFLILKDMKEEDLDKLKGFHGKYINAVNEPVGMNDFFFHKDGSSKFEKYEKPLRDTLFDLIIYCGFMC